jgi:hypothetical protein
VVLQTPLVQSPSSPQVRPVPQRLQLDPPQSMAASSPFFTPSVQVTTWQTAPTQLSEVQSSPSMQESPGAQAAQASPPQSASLSSWFFV